MSKACSKHRSARFFHLAPLALLLGLSGCGGGGGDAASNFLIGGGGGAASNVDVPDPSEDNSIRSVNPALLASTYYVSFVQPGESPTGSFSVDDAGRIANCSFLPVCVGSATPDETAEVLTVRIEANDGKPVIDNSAVIVGSIDREGNVTGEYNGRVVSRNLDYSGSISGSSTPLPSPSNTARFAGTYTMSTADGTAGIFDFDSTGNVVRCDVGGVVKCSGSVVASATGDSASFTITGNDGLNPVDTTAELSGTINQAGEIAGSFTAQSVTEGRSSGRLSGARIFGLSTTLAPAIDIPAAPAPEPTPLTCTPPKVPSGSSCVTANPKLTFDYAELNFGTVKVGETSSPQTVTLRNNGNIGVSLNNLWTTFGFGGGFRITEHTCGNLAVVLPVGATCKVTVVFEPKFDETMPLQVVINNHLPARIPRQKLSGSLEAETTVLTKTPEVKLNGTAKYPGFKAESCIQLGVDTVAQVQTIKNVCDGEIGIRWCHSPIAAKGTASSECGHEGKYYQQQSTLAPGEVKSNMFTTPLGSEISVAACAGNFLDVLGPNDGKTNYRCDGL